MPSFPLLVEVGPARPANGAVPATSPSYRVAYAKDGPPSLPGVATLFELFTCAAAAAAAAAPAARCWPKDWHGLGARGGELRGAERAALPSAPRASER
jgi:hypothetical protein